MTARDGGEAAATASADAGDAGLLATLPDTAPEIRFPVEVEGFCGTLDELVARAQRGEIDLATIPVAAITAGFRRQLAADPPPQPRQVADFLGLAARLLSLKAGRLLPEGSLEGSAAEEREGGAVDDPGARLAEYRLFRAAAEALLAEAAEQGVRSFLGLVSADVVPSERLAIAPERLAAAFRRVLERITEAEPLALDLVTFSVIEKVTALRSLLADRHRLGFEEIFEGVASRLEAVALFLALLELVKRGEARVDQPQAFGAITVTAAADS